jgi:hypothetical protein
MNIQVIHFIEKDNNNYIQLVDNFIYQNGDPIVPSNDYDWKDIYGISHIMENRNNMPPTYTINNNIITYWW